MEIIENNYEITSCEYCNSKLKVNPDDIEKMFFDAYFKGTILQDIIFKNVFRCPCCGHINVWDK